MDKNPPDLWRHLVRDARKDWVSFHMPGHIRGRAFPRAFRRYLSRMDITEVAGMDDLNDPRGILHLSQKRLASLAGADRSFFLVNGASAGIIAMMTSLCGSGDALLVPRASHRAVYHALLLGGIRPVYLCTDWREGRPLPPSPEDVGKALESCPDAAGMVLTCPDYWGRCPDEAAIADILHRKGKALLLDQAHGAHFGAHPVLPPHGGRTGADAWVQSAHKTLPALTQSAWLHIRGERIPMERIEQKIRFHQTTSPSYPMMAGLDFARHWLEHEAYDAYDRLLTRIDRAVMVLEKHTPVRRAGFSHEKGAAYTDPTRLVLDVSGLGTGAQEVEKYLLTHGIRIEWAEGDMLVLICTPWHTDRDFGRLIRALRRCPRGVKETQEPLPPMPVPSVALPMGEAAAAPAVKVPYREAAGRVSAGFVIPYPPGIPLLCPGEAADPGHIAWIGHCEAQGKYPAGVDAAGCIPVIE